MSQPKALDSENLLQSLGLHGNGNRLEPHLVAISVPARNGRKKFMSEGGKDKYFLQCKAEKKKKVGSSYTCKGVENMNLIVDVVSSSISLPV